MILLLLAQFLGGYVIDYSAPPAPQLTGVVGPAPTALPSMTLEWLQEAPNIHDTYWYIYRMYIDDKPPFMVGPPMCKGDYRPFKCSTPLYLTTTVGKHTVRLTVSRFMAGDSVQHPSRTGPESDKSNTIEFSIRQPPPAVYIQTPNEQLKPPVIIR